jgi:hypothetical protein
MKMFMLKFPAHFMEWRDRESKQRRTIIGSDSVLHFIISSFHHFIISSFNLPGLTIGTALFSQVDSGRRRPGHFIGSGRTGQA